MYIGVFDLFKVGVGPSSSHTMGPMLAACRFRDSIQSLPVARIQVTLYGSLAATGHGHATDRAIIAGLNGIQPADASAERMALAQDLSEQGHIELPQGLMGFSRHTDLVFSAECLAQHPNGMRFVAFDHAGSVLSEQVFFSIGGGFIKSIEEFGQPEIDDAPVPYPFESGEQLLAVCNRTGLGVAQIMRANELSRIDEAEFQRAIDTLYHAMQSCIDSGLKTSGLLPGQLGVKRRAHSLHKSLTSGQRKNMISIGFSGMEWVNLFALAVNEENAAGGRMVTAPTNGAAGIVPAVLAWYMRFNPGARDSDVADFLLAAAAVGSLCKKNASISGAEVGCQGEVGSACAMAAAGLCEVLGGTPEQVENAAEIGLEHNLGLTCDPIGGLVQVPCIERNAIAAVKAINAANLALQSDGKHFVSLDNVIRTLRDTGRDMQDKYKETSRGGLAINAMPVSAVEC